MYETIEAIRRSPAVRGPARRGRHAERGRRREARRRRAKGHARRARGAQGGDRGGNVVDTEGAPPGSRRRLAPRHRGAGGPAARSQRGLITVPDGFTVHPKLVKQLERRRDARGGRDGLGTDRGPRVRDAPHRRHSRPADRSGHGARHLLSPPPRPPRREDGRDVHADRVRRGVRAVSGLQLAAVRDGRARLRVRLLGVVPARARPVGSAVRRLRQLGAGDHRPVHRVGAREVAAELTAHACFRTATREAARSTRARGWSASCRWPRRRTSGSSTARLRRSTSTLSAVRRSTRSRARRPPPKGLLRLRRPHGPEGTS